MQSAPTFFSLRGSLEGDGFVYPFTARAAALVLLFVSAMLTPTASYRDHVMTTETITRAFEVCDQKMVRGSADKPCVDSPSPRGWEFFSAPGSVVGLLAFG